MATARFQVVALVRSARVSASGQPDPGTRATGAMLGAALFALYPVLRRLPPPGDLTGGSGSHSVPVRCDDGKYSGQGAWVASRQVTTTVVDPKEKLKAEAGNAYVPFWPAGRP